MPEAYQVPEFDSVDAIIGFARELARLALIEDVDPRRVAEARASATLALSGHSARTQQQLVDALLRVEAGGAAVALLAAFRDGQQSGKRTPIPGRVLPLPPRDPEPA